MPAPYLFDLPASVSDLDCRPDGGRREAGRRPTHRSYCSIALKHRFQAVAGGAGAAVGSDVVEVGRGRADEVAVLGAGSVLSPGAVDEQAYRMISADLRSLI
jgi:hypothetical protein